MANPEGIATLMNRALVLAERGGGATAPNPMVGCVLVDPDGRILGEGFHVRAGEGHAEAAAISAARAAGHELKGATAIVTLEPCAHHGNTPPCADQLALAGVARVFYAMADPHVGKGGAERLRQAGIEATGGIGQAESRRLNEPWLHFTATGRPLIHLKTAQTLNARVTRDRDDERRITGADAERAVHRLRRRHRAVLVGIGTVLADDPLLTVREWPEAGGDAADPDVQPLRVVLDSRLRIPLDSRLVRTASESPVLVLCSPVAPTDREAALGQAGVEVIRLPTTGAGLDLLAVATELGRRGATGILVEPGPTLATGFLESGLADRWTMFFAAEWITSRGALPVLLSEAPRTGFVLEDAAWEIHGRDASVSGRIRLGVALPAHAEA